MGRQRDAAPIIPIFDLLRNPGSGPNILCINKREDFKAFVGVLKIGGVDSYRAW
jgi:hypothetical protein